MYKQIIVVEGIHDCEHLQHILPGVETISVNGSEISKACIDMLVELSKTRELILFFDPDYPGQRIRSIISNHIPKASHAFIKKEDCISNNKKKVGVEHASKEAILKALENKLEYKESNNMLTNDDLYRLGLCGKPTSAFLREKISNYYHLDLPNGKTLLKRLNMLGITVSELEEALR